jgi:hypothetical protein
MKNNKSHTCLQSLVVLVRWATRFLLLHLDFSAGFYSSTILLSPTFIFRENRFSSFPQNILIKTTPSPFSFKPNMFSVRSIFGSQLRRSILILHSSSSSSASYSASSAATVQAERAIREGPRNDWTRDEIKSVYDSPLLDLLFHGVSINFFFFYRFLFFRISVSLKCVYQLSVWLLRKCRKVKENEKKKKKK